MIKYKDLCYIFDEDIKYFILSGHTFYAEAYSNDSTWFYAHIQYVCKRCNIGIKIKNNNFIFFEEKNVLFKIDANQTIGDEFLTCDKYCNLKLIKNIIE